MKQNIEFVRGETVSLAFSMIDPDTGGSFEVLSTDVFRFGMETAAGDSVLSKSTTGSAIVALSPADTIGLEPGKYYYDVGLQRDSDYYVIVQKSVITLIDNVTKYSS